MINDEFTEDRKLIETEIFKVNDNFDSKLKGYSSLFLTICDTVTKLKYKIEKFKKTIEQTYAVIDGGIRENSKSNLTETIVKNKVRLDESYIKLNERLFELNEEYDKWLNLKQVFENNLQILLYLSSINNNKNKFKKF